ncbi:MAG: hypothetical protein JST17_04480 [Bacteroidetes bacterium]|nr:hypothetical protein [Bacteroidota bacterium]MBS1929667.1 hypothetical protein [Bacteroidota bacterium]
MKPKSITISRLLPALSILILTIALVSWDFKKSPGQQQKATYRDTLPPEKNNSRDKQIRNLDDVLDELDASKMKLNIEQVQKEVNEAMKNIDMDKVKTEIDRAMKEVDIEKIKQNVEESVAKINWDKIKTQLEEVKMISTGKLQREMKEVQKNLGKIGPEIQKELDKAKEKIEKAKAEMKEYKSFLDGLEKDGLVDTKGDYSIKHKSGELFINGKKATDDVYNKYRPFLEKHKTFTIEKDGDNFNIRLNNHIRVI